MKGLASYIPSRTHIDFMRWRQITIIASGIVCVAALVLYIVIGLNYGVDFRGGIMVEIRAPQAIDMSAMRSTLNRLNLGEVEIQQFGQPTDAIIRVESQEGDEKAQLRAVEAVRGALGNQVEYRRVEFVGPKVGAELVEKGVIATVLTILGIAIYVWFRFEWQFGVAAVVSILHDVMATIGLFAVTGMVFDLTSLAAVLTIAGYSINDTVVIFDRVRENLRKYKQMGLIDLINLSVNETLSRTILTTATTLLAVLCLALFGGPVIRGFSLAMLFGLLVGTYSTVYIAAPLVIYTGLKRSGRLVGEDSGPARAAERLP